MKNTIPVLVACMLLSPLASQAEILAMANYESKPDDSLKDLKMPFGTNARREGVAVFDVDPESETYGDILIDIPLPPDLVAHHLFWNRDHTKIYLTALGKPELRVIDMTRNPYRVKVIDVPDCQVGEDVIFSDDNTRWYETCMGSNVVVMGDAVNDSYTKTIQTNVPYPHGIDIHEGIDRMLVTSTVRASDLQDAGEAIGVLEASSGKPLSTIKVSDKPSPSGEAPVEILWVPQSDPPVAWITNMYGGTLWTLTWNAEKEDFEAGKGFDFAEHEAGIPLEIYFNGEGTELYVTTSNPGKMHFFDLSEDKKTATLTKTLDTAGGAHHVAFTKDGHHAFVQNSFINLPGMSDGSISVVDMGSREVIDTINTFKDKGLNPNCIVLLSEWDDPMGH